MSTNSTTEKINRTPGVTLTDSIRTTVAGALIAAVAAAASAQDGVGFPPDAAPRVELLINGEVAEVCGVRLTGDETPNFLETTSAGYQVSLTCNRPFVLQAEAEYGELRNEELYDPATPESYLQYEIEWPVMLDSAGAPIAPNFNADGREWAQILTYESQGAAFDVAGEMRLTWGAREDLLAGPYSDVVALEISMRR